MSGHITYNISDANNNQYDGINQTGHNEQWCPKNDKRSKHSGEEEKNRKRHILIKEDLKIFKNVI